MFLTRGDMPHEATWAAWLESAKGMVPIDLVAESSMCRNSSRPCGGRDDQVSRLVCSH